MTLFRAGHFPALNAATFFVCVYLLVLLLLVIDEMTVTWLAFCWRDQSLPQDLQSCRAPAELAGDQGVPAPTATSQPLHPCHYTHAKLCSP